MNLNPNNVFTNRYNDSENTFQLLNKDKVLVEFKEPNALGVYKIVNYDSELLSIMPPAFAGGVNENTMRTFIENRTVPVNRHHMDIVFSYLGYRGVFNR